MTQTQSFYPLSEGNIWTYKVGDGSTYTNEVVSQDAGGGLFTMVNSTSQRPVSVHTNSEGIHSDAYEAGKFTLLLKADPKVGDAWSVMFNANGFENQLDMKVKEAGLSLTVEGKAYSDVVVVEAESKMLVNGNWMALNFFTQYHYAPGVGLILTTSSHGDNQALIDYKLA
jgi:hypothetical protein